MTTPRIHDWRLRVFATGLATVLAAAGLAPLPEAEAGLDPLVEAQQLVYETNLARWNPPAFAARAGDVDFPAGFVAAPPVALNSNLVASACSRPTNWQITTTGRTKAR